MELWRRSGTESEVKLCYIKMIKNHKKNICKIRR